APLTLSFARQKDIICHVFPDERSAAFVALGIAQSTGHTVALVCTSGTATLNFAPAIAEAYYSHVPLLILTADRPPEWIDQQDGQTIRQENIYGRHVKASYTLPVDTSHEEARWHLNRSVNEAINNCMILPMGPVHVNVPLREPLYLLDKEPLTPFTIIRRSNPEYTLLEEKREELQKRWAGFNKTLIVPGQGIMSPSLQESLKSLMEAEKAVVVADIISNAGKHGDIIRHHDLFLGQIEDTAREALRPDLLITFGRSVVSKNLKLFLRNFPPMEHWHVQAAGEAADPFKTLTDIIPCAPDYFFKQLSPTNVLGDYAANWKKAENLTTEYEKGFFEDIVFGEFFAVKSIMKELPGNAVLHFGNSMPIRYGNFINAHEAEEVFCNRGTSGIEGVNSTVTGHAIANAKVNYLITGDTSFLYDRNAFWTREVPENLKIIVLNNRGGGIFRMIEGPASQPELEDYFEVRHAHTAEPTAREFGFNYYQTEGPNTFPDVLRAFIQDPLRSILEVFSESKVNASLFSNYKKGLYHVLNK
ncbi:MAG: 2-succinyl-5-enolpyruvyl-6-hydroxy-3-cyclohexene-1-carboxylic-acid synthase, partial [Cyclobacteriaceae bacterium]|nr:2-succinyl-5-enolpyruvyl-6-hydroxy-3-cyclohexene-1-carboxylic-acid synthase [Cyclobacteriaceae bacterium]